MAAQSEPPANARLRDNVVGALKLAVSASRRDFFVVAGLAGAGAIMPTLILLASRHVVNLIVDGSETGRIGLVISHRFSTVRIADRIAVLDSGRVAELGTHDELLRNGQRYAELFNLQAAGYR